MLHAACTVPIDCTQQQRPSHHVVVRTTQVLGATKNPPTAALHKSRLYCAKGLLLLRSNAATRLSFIFNQANL